MSVSQSAGPKPARSDSDTRHFDFIVCGAGSGGSVVAGRLAANPEVRVLLIEAGGSDDVPEVMDPGQWHANFGSERDWQFVAQPNPNLNGRAIPLNMGKVLGGGSSINLMVWARGHKNDWEHFASESGDPAWGYDSVLEIYRRIENWQGAPDPVRRGVGGPVFVQSAADPQPVALALLEAGREAGLPSFETPNGEMMEGRGGVSISDQIIRDGKRASIFRSYVHPLIGQTNLTVLTHTMVRKLLFSGTAVVGVEVIEGSERKRYKADREVILSLGAHHTPKVLMQSGIGPRDELRRHDIEMVQHLPGVGQNHQDHIAVGCVFTGTEPVQAGNGGSEATLYWKSEAGLDRPDIFHCQGEFPMVGPDTAKSSSVPPHGWSLYAGLSHPKSRGQLRLSGPDVLDPIVIDANTFSDPSDFDKVVKSVELAREIGNSATFRQMGFRESLPGKLDRDAMDNFIRNAAGTYHHLSCTAKMGRDGMSVVDHRLKVYGIERLRIADASIMPEVTSGNTMAPCVVIGERAAELIKTAYGI